MNTTTNAISRASMSSGRAAHYLFYEDRLHDNIMKMRNAFIRRYGNFDIAYSFKTNYMRQICETIADMKCYAEVVSPFEYQYAKQLCRFTDQMIVYNGVIPDVEQKFKVASAGGYVNVDNIDEYRTLSKYAERMYCPIRIGVRLNPDVGNGLVSRFGVDVEGNDLENLMNLIKDDPFVSFRGFHCHIGTSRPAKYWRRKTEIMISLAKKYNAEYIDLGGGMFGPMPDELSCQFADYALSFDEYAVNVCTLMKEAFPGENVKLIVEPGTALVGNTMDLVAHVTNIKEVRGKTYITVDTCSNHLGMICECRVIPMKVYHDNMNEQVRVEDACIAGCTCLEFDYIRQKYSGLVAVGDTVVFENVGAYSIGASRQFIVPRLAVVDAMSGRMLRAAEDAGDMFGKNFECYY